MAAMMAQVRIERAFIGWRVVVTETRTPAGGVEWGTVERKWFVQRRHAEQYARFARWWAARLALLFTGNAWFR